MYSLVQHGQLTWILTKEKFVPHVILQSTTESWTILLQYWHCQISQRCRIWITFDFQRWRIRSLFLTEWSLFQAWSLIPLHWIWPQAEHIILITSSLFFTTDVVRHHSKKMQTTSEFREIEDDGLGRTQLLISMKGPVDNPRFGYDRKGRRRKSKMILWKKSRTWKASWRRNLECSGKIHPEWRAGRKKKNCRLTGAVASNHLKVSLIISFNTLFSFRLPFFSRDLGWFAHVFCAWDTDIDLVEIFEIKCHFWFPISRKSTIFVTSALEILSETGVFLNMQADVNIYTQKQRWKLLLLIAALLIGAASLWYTNKLVDNWLTKSTKKLSYGQKLQRLADVSEVNTDINFLSSVISNNNTIPVIWADENFKVISSRNLDSLAFTGYNLNKQVLIMREQHEPIEIKIAQNFKQYILYKDSELLIRLRYYP